MAEESGFNLKSRAGDRHSRGREGTAHEFGVDPSYATDEFSHAAGASSLCGAISRRLHAPGSLPPGSRNDCCAGFHETRAKDRHGCDEKCGSADSRGSWLLEFAPDAVFEGPGAAETRRRGADARGRRRPVRQKIRRALQRRGEDVGSRCWRRVKGFVMIKHPPRQGRFGGFLDPLVDQSRNFLAQIRGMVQSRQLEALQGGA